MSQFKYLTASPTFDELIFGLSLHLNDIEQQHFHLAYNKYQKDRSIIEFVDALVPLFTTGPRRTLINPIRKILKPVDVPKYNQLLVRHGYLTTRKPLSMKLQEHYDAKQRAQTLPRNIGSSTPVDGGIKKITLKRDSLGDLGFSIRGGAEYHLGIFISWVDAGSAAAKSGLVVGDQILQVNGASFEGISHSRAVQHLRKAQRLRIVVLNSQRFPVAKHGDTRYHWIDPISGQPTPPPPNSVLNKELLLQDSDIRKVRLETRHNEDLGFSIRGGLEHELGLFLVDVEPNSTAESVGLLPGDLIIDVNGVDFTNISHRDAISILKSHPVMLITLKHVGKIPVSITSQTGPTEWHRIKQRNPSNLTSATQSLSSRTAKKFVHGYGTQMMHQKQQPHASRHLIEHRTKQLLSEIESNTIMYYLNEYRGHGLTIEAFLTVILDMLDTPDKLVLLADIRQVVFPKDIEYFDRFV
ncbi:hypothetical protein LOD99_6659 [Oopsacas minuta]|uniref:PDZ domain-containing protein n=1 Tax=Oopsacas minuta TaxID=111878 RepID=A0AAV7JMQ6_9METZ|nr:hypothetical protein LOD99_6659 [Oopsacas minuta]